MAGTIGRTATRSATAIAELALRDRVPLVMLLDGAGFRADGKAYGRAPTDLLIAGALLGTRAGRHRRARRVGRPRRAGRADVGLRR